MKTVKFDYYLEETASCSPSTQRPAQEWLNERTAVTGEKLELE